MTRRQREKPFDKEVADFVRWHLADRKAFAPFTGTDYDAWRAYIHLVRLWGRSASDGVLEALRAVVNTAQIRNQDVMAVFKKSIPCILDWSDEPALWKRIGPEVPLHGVMIDLQSVMASQKHELRRVMWPCADGGRICKHENSKPYKHAHPEPGYTLDQECRTCGAIWREQIVAPTK